MNEPVDVRAVRLGRQWTAEQAVHGVYPHGRTLAELQQSAEAGLALLNMHAEVTLVATSPELENLRESRTAYETALRAAVIALHLRRTTLTDITRATGTSRAEIKRILTDSRTTA